MERKQTEIDSVFDRCEKRVKLVEILVGLELEW